MKASKSLLAALLTLVLFLWGCTSSSNKQSEGGTLTIGTELEYPPFSYLQDNNIVGFDIDVIVEACTRLNLEYDIKPIPHFDALIPELIIGKIDVIAAGMSPTKEREKRVLFTNPHYKGNGFVIIANPGIKPVSSFQDLSGYTVAVNEGYTSESILEEVPNVTMLRLRTPTEALLALKADHVDAFLIANSAAQPLLKSSAAEDYSVFKITEAQEGVAFALKKENTELLEKLNGALEQMKIDGTLKKIKTKWSLE